MDGSAFGTCTINNTDGVFAVQAGTLKNTGVMNINTNVETDHKKIRFLRALHKSVEKNRKDRNPDRVPGTCEWFTNHEKFRDWEKSPTSRMLWVSADPGSGKSVLAKYLVDLFPTTEARTTCYFFFKDDFEGQGSAITALCCILFQLFDAKPALLSKYIVDRFEIADDGFTGSFEELWNAFRMVVKNDTGEIVCIIDALDECKYGERFQLIEKLRQLYNNKGASKFNLKLLITSRPIREIRLGFHHTEISAASLIHLNGESEAEIKKISKEIGIFIETKVQNIGEKFGLTIKERDLLLKKLTSVPNRTYLWVYLTLNLIENDASTHITIDTRENRMLEIASRLPKTVDEAYERILSQSYDQVQAKLILQILVAAARPLRLREMWLAMQLAVDSTCTSYRDLKMQDRELADPKDLKELEDRIQNDIRDLCGLFVVVIESAVYLIHQTAKEFLVTQQIRRSRSSTNNLRWKGSLLLWESHRILFSICMQHLFFEELQNEACVPENSGNVEKKNKLASEYVQKYNFLSYSANNWASHLKDAQMNLDKATVDRISELCDVTSNRCQLWLHVYWGTPNDSVPPVAFNKLMLASYFGLHEVVKTLRKEWAYNYEIDKTDSTNGRSALSWAAGNGFENVVAEFVKPRNWKGIPLSFKKQHANVNSLDHHKRTPLIHAVWNQHIPVIKLLLKAGASIKQTDDIGGTALSYAICTGREDIIELFLKKGKTFDERSSITQRLFFSAAENGRDEIVKMLLLGEGEISLDERDDVYRTPLMAGAKGGHDEVVKILLDGDADIEAVDKDGWRPIMYAAWQGRINTVKILLKSGANVQAKDRNGQTAIMHSARGGHMAVVELLLDGENMEAIDSKGRTLLIFAAQGGHLDTVELLLSRGASIEVTDDAGYTPLAHAAENKHGSVLQLLVEHGADLTLTLRNHLSQIISIAAMGNYAALDSILEKGVDLDQRDKYGSTALLYALMGGHKGLFQSLLLRGANIEIVGPDGGTPLHYVARGYGDSSIFSQLLQGGANVDAVDSSGWTPLFLVVDRLGWGSDRSMVEALLNNGANTKARLIRGKLHSLMYAAIDLGALWLISLLLDKGADIEEKGALGLTPLLYALRGKRPNFDEIVQLLLKRGAKREV
ncbi:hypothetical protein TWF706_000329 [Orbilia oligospora]|nr:hypothetical protein TWF706_000329 [Orbilia oligospora]